MSDTPGSNSGTEATSESCDCWRPQFLAHEMGVKFLPQRLWCVGHMGSYTEQKKQRAFVSLPQRGVQIHDFLYRSPSHRS